MGKLDDLKKAIENEKEQETKINLDKPPVKIFEMQVNALLRLADDTNEIFSEITKSESIDLTVASLFGKNPCPNINERLKNKGIEFQIALPVLDEYISEVLRHRHKMNRKRVEEFLRALETLKSGGTDIKLMDERPPLMRRLV